MDTINDKIIKVNLITLIPQSNNNGLLYLIKKKYLVHMSQTELNHIQSSIHTSGVFDTSTYKSYPYYLFKPAFKKILNDKSLKVKNKVLILSAIVVGDKPDRTKISFDDIPNEIYTKNDGNVNVNIHFIMAILSNGLIHFINNSCIIKLRYCQYILIKNKITSSDVEVINTTDYNFGLNQLTFNEQINKLSSISIPQYYIIKAEIIN
jgi:hypothetical protein